MNSIFGLPIFMGVFITTFYKNSLIHRFFNSLFLLNSQPRAKARKRSYVNDWKKSLPKLATNLRSSPPDKLLAAMTFFLFRNQIIYFIRLFYFSRSSINLHILFYNKICFFRSSCKIMLWKNKSLSHSTI